MDADLDNKKKKLMEEIENIIFEDNQELENNLSSELAEKEEYEILKQKRHEKDEQEQKMKENKLRQDEEHIKNLENEKRLNIEEHEQARQPAEKHPA